MAISLHWHVVCPLLTRSCWPPENEQRASRLQQLVDSMADLQTDVKDVATKMDKKNVQYRPAIDKLLKANGMDSVDDVIDKAAAEMTPDERKAFEAVRYYPFPQAGPTSTKCSKLMVPIS